MRYMIRCRSVWRAAAKAVATGAVAVVLLLACPPTTGPVTEVTLAEARATVAVGHSHQVPTSTQDVS